MESIKSILREVWSLGEMNADNSHGGFEWWWRKAKDSILIRIKRSDLNCEVAEVLPIDENNPWDTLSVISKLVEAADILLHRKDYDGHGWEEIEICYKRGLELLNNARNRIPENISFSEKEQLTSGVSEKEVLNQLMLKLEELIKNSETQADIFDKNKKKLSREKSIAMAKSYKYVKNYLLVNLKSYKT